MALLKTGEKPRGLQVGDKIFWNLSNPNEIRLEVCTDSGSYLKWVDQNGNSHLGWIIPCDTKERDLLPLTRLLCQVAGLYGDLSIVLSKDKLVVFQITK